VGGKIAQLGARLIDATAKQMADAFFDRFVAAVGAPAGGAQAAAAEVSGPSLIRGDIGGLPLVAWVGGAIFVAIFILIFSAYI
jgi:hypothetical protein